MDTAVLKDQYEDLPYPERDPQDEKKRLITGSPGDLDEIIHYIFAGHWPRGKPLRILIAGGGTGDGLIMLAQQADDAGIDARITYVDLSSTSRRIAEERARIRGLTSITFLTGSFLDLKEIEGPFDYIDSCGVLHHLPDPAAALGILRKKLAPGGGMGLMVYGAYGRTGLYSLQKTLRTLTAGLSRQDSVALARRVVESLPATNWFRRNPFLGDHLRSDAGLYDLLLHSRDRAFTVPEFLDLVRSAGLAVSSFIEPARYDPATWVRDLNLQALSPEERAAVAETLSGNMAKHIAYLVPQERAGTAAATLDNPDLAPVPKRINPAQVAAGLKPGAGLTVELGGNKTTLPLPPLAAAILGRIDGKRSWNDIHSQMEKEGIRVAMDAFWSQARELYEKLNGVNMLLLRKAS
ncbi:MAG: class I SAM-dependent methyltransferase [Pseudomonadota bacterium]|nr:class I SAM-dependent methyltransferase [Pseudomonadota bacterium]